MKPEQADGLLLHLSQPRQPRGAQVRHQARHGTCSLQYRQADFLSLLLVNGTLLFTYGLGSQESVTTIRAPCCMELNQVRLSVLVGQ